MPNVVGPMFSVAASGNFGGAIEFLCGGVVKKAKPKPKKNKGVEDKEDNAVTEAQSTQRTKFQEAKDYWKLTLGEHQRTEWYEFTKIVVTSGKCVGKTLKLSGYTCWMKFYLKYGEGGWPGFPDPPEDWIAE